jgi:gentisate 1,2-dioxygenase
MKSSPNWGSVDIGRTGATVSVWSQSSGVDKIDAIELQWNDHDSFTIPSWSWHAHKNLSGTEPVILFSFTDRPLLKMTGLDREEND